MGLAHDIGIDLGNSKFSICVKGEGIVASESSFLAYIGDVPTEKSVVAVGDAARDMFERCHEDVNVINPMREGIVVDCLAAALVLKGLARNAGLRWTWSKPRTLVAALFGASDIERRAFGDVAECLTRRRPWIVPEPVAAANGTQIEMSAPHANMLVDVGDGATEAVVMSQGQVIVGNSMRFGGHDVDTMLKEHLRKRHGMIVSRTQARAIKETLAKVGEGEIAVKGINVHGYLPSERRLPVADFAPLLDSVANSIVEFTMSTLAMLPPEVAVDLIENGVYLCGGASRMAGVRDRLMERCNLAVHAVEEPQRAVISGLDRMLTYSGYF